MHASIVLNLDAEINPMFFGNTKIIIHLQKKIRFIVYLDSDLDRAKLLNTAQKNFSN